MPDEKESVVKMVPLDRIVEDRSIQVRDSLSESTIKKPYGGCVRIMLPGGMEAIVDSEDYRLVAGFRWHSHKNNRSVYARTSLQIRTADGKRESHLWMHKLVLPGVSLVDHRDGNGLNNRRGNLRPATHQQNMRNRRLTNGKKFKGAFHAKGSARWFSSICVNYRNIYLGSFDSEEEAACAYDAAARLYFGEFCTPNFQEGESK